MKAGKYIVAAGDEEEGYYPPSNVESADDTFVALMSMDDMRNKIRNYIKRYSIPDALGWNIDNLDWNDYITYTDFSVYGLYETSSNPKIKKEVVFSIDEVTVSQKLKIEHTRMPALLVSSATTWSRNIAYKHKLIQNSFKQNNKNYIIPKSVSSIGLMDFTTELVQGEEYGYRGKAYNSIFYQMKEKDVVNILLQLEEASIEGSPDAYEFMRDTYKLLKQSQEYSDTLEADAAYKINPNTYKYLYVPESVIYYNDTQTQQIYWLELLAAEGVDDYITKDELANMRTKNQEITWQIVDYDAYEECDGKVYALNPFGSAYVRAYFQKALDDGYYEKINGNFSEGSHSGADWGGRAKINEILQQGSSAVTSNNIPTAIYNYEYQRLAGVYGDVKAKSRLEEILKEEVVNMPIVSVAPGYVEDIGYDSREGFYVVVKHSDSGGRKVVTRYMHLKRWPLVNVGDYIGAGTYLGYEGDTGRSTGTHLHFQLEINDVPTNPINYILPTFNPFYYSEKAEEAGYRIYSDYMSLYRTVYIGDIENGTNVGNIVNTVPVEPLLESTDYLIQKQGTIVREIENGGMLDWTTQIELTSGSTLNDNSKKYYQNIFGHEMLSALDTRYSYMKYLYDNDIFNRYNYEMYYDEQMATVAGLLEVPYELYLIIYGNIPVKTDMPGSLPALTREELEYILDNWLEARYGRSEEKINHLRETVFTEETIQAILDAQDKYKVSAVFMLAVATQEQQLGTVHFNDPKYILSNEEICNIFSIMYSESALNEGSVEYIGANWNDYESYTQAFEDFSQLIGERGPYFKNGKYTISTIGQTYCVPPHGWINGVTSICMEILQYYIGNDWSMPLGPGIWYGDNESLAAAAINCFAYYAANGFDYCQEVHHSIPPYSGNAADGNFMNLRCIQGTSKCGCCGSAKKPGVSLPRTDCSAYVTWVLYEYYKAIGLSDMQEFFSSQRRSGTWKEWGDNITTNEKTVEGVMLSDYFDIVYDYKNPYKPTNQDELFSMLQPGDILVEFDGYGGTHHVEIYIGIENDELDLSQYPNAVSKSGVNSANIYSCGLFKKEKLYNEQWAALKYVFRPLPREVIEQRQTN